MAALFCNDLLLSILQGTMRIQGASWHLGPDLHRMALSEDIWRIVGHIPLKILVIRGSIVIHHFTCHFLFELVCYVRIFYCCQLDTIWKIAILLNIYWLVQMDRLRILGELIGQRYLFFKIKVKGILKVIACMAYHRKIQRNIISGVDRRILMIFNFSFRFHLTVHFFD